MHLFEKYKAFVGRCAWLVIAIFAAGLYLILREMNSKIDAFSVLALFSGILGMIQILTWLFGYKVPVFQDSFRLFYYKKTLSKEENEARYRRFALRNTAILLPFFLVFVVLGLVI